MKAKVNKITERVFVTIEHPLDRCWIQNSNLDIQLRLDGDKIYCSASDDFSWQDKIISATVPFGIFWEEWRKFCDAMRSREKYADQK